MKRYGFIMMAGLAALAIASTASAQSTNFIRITGSTAFRSATHTAIGHILNAGYLYGYSGTTLSGASQAEFRGTTVVGGHPVDIKASWSGSVGGVQTVAKDLTVSTWLNATNLTAGGTSGLTGPYDAPTKADVAMSDSYQSSTIFTSPQLVDQIVGVVPFRICRNNGSPSTMSNATALAMQALLSNGTAPLSQFTGDPADSNGVVYAVGRDEDSGTRLVEFAETGFGILTAPIQYQIFISNNTVTNIHFYPPNTVNGISYPAGHSGYSSGGLVATAMIASNSSTSAGDSGGGYLLTFVGLSDAITITNGGGAFMTYNGGQYSPAAVQQGQYTAWSYEHLMYRNSFADGGGLFQKTVTDQIATQLHDVDASPTGVLIGTMQYGRTVEGGVITLGNPY